MDLREFLLEYFRGHTYHPMRAKKIAEHFGLRQEARLAFYELLDDMLAKGELRSTKKGRLRAADAHVGKRGKANGVKGTPKEQESVIEESTTVQQSDVKGGRKKEEGVIEKSTKTQHPGTKDAPKKEVDTVEESTKVQQSGADSAPKKNEGVLRGNARGFAFFISDDPQEPDAFIPASELNGALHGDRVRIRITKRGDKEHNWNPEGRVQRVLQREGRPIVGTFYRQNRMAYVVPDSKNYFRNIRVEERDAAGAKNEDKVVVCITEYPRDDGNPQGRITEVLGALDEKGVDITSVARKFELPYEFSDAALQEAEVMPDAVDVAAMRGRRDFRKLHTVTMDGADAKDFDDAISIEKRGRFYNLYVHIADVSHYVKEGSALDRDAYERGNSVYLLDRVIPMLPEKLSNGICSLNPGVDRLTMTTQMTVNEKGEVVDYRFFRSVIRSDYRLVYDEVSDYLENGKVFSEDKKLCKQLNLMQELFQILAEKRRARGTLDFDLPETMISLDENGVPKRVGWSERRVANRIIEEFMILNNEVVGTHFYQKKLPFVYRVHENPSEEKVERLNQALYAFHYDPLPPVPQPADLRRILEQAAGKKEEHVLNMLVLTSMAKAAYRPVAHAHFGLAAAHYSHFTSPIRRYADLMAHRLLKALLDGKPVLKEDIGTRLEEPCKHISQTEIQAEDAERDVVDMKCAEYMANHVGEVWPATVSSLTNFGVFLTLSNSIEGLAHFRDMTDDYYSYDSERFVVKGENTGRKIRYGEEYSVLITKSSPEMREIDFQIQWPENGSPSEKKFEPEKKCEPKKRSEPEKKCEPEKKSEQGIFERSMQKPDHSETQREAGHPEQCGETNIFHKEERARAEKSARGDRQKTVQKGNRPTNGRQTRGGKVARTFAQFFGKRPKNWKGAAMSESAKPRQAASKAQKESRNR